jgi:hypothetical protein
VSSAAAYYARTLCHMMPVRMRAAAMPTALLATRMRLCGRRRSSARFAACARLPTLAPPAPSTQSFLARNCCTLAPHTTARGAGNSGGKCRSPRALTAPSTPRNSSRSKAVDSPSADVLAMLGSGGSEAITRLYETASQSVRAAGARKSIQRANTLPSVLTWPYMRVSLRVAQHVVLRVRNCVSQPPPRTLTPPPPLLPPLLSPLHTIAAATQAWTDDVEVTSGGSSDSAGGGCGGGASTRVLVIEHKVVALDQLASARGAGCGIRAAEVANAWGCEWRGGDAADNMCKALDNLMVPADERVSEHDRTVCTGDRAVDCVRACVC